MDRDKPTPTVYTFIFLSAFVYSFRVHQFIKSNKTIFNTQTLTIFSSSPITHAFLTINKRLDTYTPTHTLMVQVVQQLVKEILDPLSALTWGFRESNTFFSHLLLTTCTSAAKVWKKKSQEEIVKWFWHRPSCSSTFETWRTTCWTGDRSTTRWVVFSHSSEALFVYYICKHRYNYPRNISVARVCLCVCLHACERVHTTNSQMSFVVLPTFIYTSLWVLTGWRPQKCSGSIRRCFFSAATNTLPGGSIKPSIMLTTVTCPSGCDAIPHTANMRVELFLQLSGVRTRLPYCTCTRPLALLTIAIVLVYCCYF